MLTEQPRVRLGLALRKVVNKMHSTPVWTPWVRQTLHKQLQVTEQKPSQELHWTPESTVRCPRQASLREPCTEKGGRARRGPCGARSRCVVLGGEPCPPVRCSGA